MTAVSLLRLICICILLAVSALAKPVVVIDAGHGGHDRGGMPGQRVPEKGYCLDVAKRLSSALQSSGFRTVMTRTSDVFVPLGTRCAIANQHRNAIFISIHFNGARNYDAYGIETYYCRGRESLALANAIHRQVLSATGSIDRRVRSRRFHVLRETRGPAVLCELGFLTNRDEARKISGGSYRQRLASAIAKAVNSRY